MTLLVLELEGVPEAVVLVERVQDVRTGRAYSDER